MYHSAIPDWNAQGLLPPINPASPTSFDRSPYLVSLADLVLRYATSAERRIILEGLLDFRKALHSVGLQQGFQWLDGSFLEDIEMIESRPPDDFDLVTFYHLQAGVTQQGVFVANQRLFDPSQTKIDYHVDAYFVQLDNQGPELLVRHSAYWYGVWSHRRNDIWKGFLQVDLASQEDADALAILTKATLPGGQS